MVGGRQQHRMVLPIRALVEQPMPEKLGERDGLRVSLCDQVARLIHTLESGRWVDGQWHGCEVSVNIIRGV